MKQSKPLNLKVGERVRITVRTHDGKVQKTYPTSQVIAAVYDDGTVRTCTGDVWSVQRTDHGLVAVA